MPKELSNSILEEVARALIQERERQPEPPANITTGLNWIEEELHAVDHVDFRADPDLLVAGLVRLAALVVRVAEDVREQG